MNRHALISGLLLALFTVHPSFACQGSSVILDENFKSPESGWDPPDDHVSYGPSGAVLKPSPKTTISPFNRHYTSDGMDLCVTGIWPSSDTKASEYDGVGVVFWAKDNQNYYVANVTRPGAIHVDRLIANTWQEVLTEPDDKHADLVHKQPGGANEVEVQISGTKAIVWVNGKKIFDFSGQPPPGSGYVGLYGDNNGQGDFSLTFPKFRIATYP